VEVTTALAAPVELQPPPEIPLDDLDVPELVIEELEPEDSAFTDAAEFDPDREPPQPLLSPPIAIPATRFAPRRRRFSTPVHAPAARSPASARPRVAAGVAQRRPPAPVTSPPVRTQPVPTIEARLQPGAARPAYPPLARRRGYAGVVMLAVHVRADGTVSRVAVAESSGYDVLDQAAVDTALSWRFDAATRGGAAVASIVRKPVRFSF